MNLFMAIYEEHKARTGHDIYTQDSVKSAFCNVCMWLNSEKVEMEKAEREANERDRIINDVDPLGQG